MALGMFMKNYQPPKFQWSAVQIGQDSSIYIPNIILGKVFDVISHLICVFYRNFIFKYLRNQCRYLQTVNSVFQFYPFMEIYVIRMKKIRLKKSRSTHQYSTMFFQLICTTLYTGYLDSSQSHLFLKCQLLHLTTLQVSFSRVL